MTLVGKIFTTLILVMSVLFLGIAITVFATHKNWRVLVEHADTGLKTQLATANNKLRDMQDEQARSLELLATEQAARRHALGSLHTKWQDQAEKLRTTENAFSKLQADHRRYIEVAEQSTIALEKLNTEVVKLRQEILAAQQARDTTFTQIVNVTDQLNESEGTLRQLQEIQNQLAEQVSEYKKVLDAHDLTLADGDLRAPTVDGLVTKVGKSDLIEISLGSDDGLREGHTLDVFRKGTYLGRVIVRHLQPDRAVGVIVKEFRRGLIKEGDRVATNLANI